MMAIAAESPIPQQILKFWAGSKNKENIQLLAKKIALRDLRNIIVSDDKFHQHGTTGGVGGVWHR